MFSACTMYVFETSLRGTRHTGNQEKAALSFLKIPAVWSQLLPNSWLPVINQAGLMPKPHRLLPLNSTKQHVETKVSNIWNVIQEKLLINKSLQTVVWAGIHLKVETISVHKGWCSCIHELPWASVCTWCTEELGGLFYFCHVLLFSCTIISTLISYYCILLSGPVNLTV